MVFHSGRFSLPSVNSGDTGKKHDRKHDRVRAARNHHPLGRAHLGALAQKTQGVAAAAGGSVTPWRMVDLLRWPGVFKTTAVDAEALHKAALALLTEALGELDATRTREGAQP